MKATAKADTMTVTVKVMGKEYSVNCPPAEHEALVASAEFVNERMTAIKKRGRALDAERIAVMAALNLAREYLALSGDASVVSPEQKLIERVGQMQRDIERSLSEP